MTTEQEPSWLQKGHVNLVSSLGLACVAVRSVHLYQHSTAQTFLGGAFFALFFPPIVRELGEQ